MCICGARKQWSNKVERVGLLNYSMSHKHAGKSDQHHSEMLYSKHARRSSNLVAELKGTAAEILD